MATPSNKPAAKRTTATKRVSNAKPATRTAPVTPPKPATLSTPAPQPATRTAPVTPAKPATAEPAKPAVVTNFATPATTVKVTETATKTPALDQKSGEQLGSSLQQGQRLCLDAAQTWVNAFSTPPVMDLSKIPGLPHLGNMTAATKFTFDVAADLLSTQRDFTLQLARVLLPTKTA